MLRRTANPHEYVETAPSPRLTFELGRGPFAYSPAHQGRVLPGFALPSFGLQHTDAVPGPPRPLYGPLDLVDLPVPLWSFQAVDVLSMLNRKAWGQFAEVGLGKTVCALSAFQILQQREGMVGLLVLGPESARHAWVGPSSDTLKFGIPAACVQPKKPIPNSGVVFCSYDKAYRPRYAIELLRRVKSGKWCLVLDEMHQIGGVSTCRHKGVAMLTRFCTYRWGLTGTPISNYPDKLHGVWRLLTSSELTLETWEKWFRPRGGDGADGWHTARLRGLGEYLKEISRVRTRREVAPDLPVTTIREICVEMEGRQREAYTSLLADKSTDWKTQLVYLTSVASHHQLHTSTGAITEETGKLEVLRGILEELDGAKCIVWSWHPRVLQWLASVLGVPCVQYHGGTSEAGRAEAIARFNADPKVQLFLGNPSAAGAGINLPDCDVRCFWDVNWKSVEYLQAKGRNERGLAHRPKLEYRLISARSIEKVVWGRLEQKGELADLVLAGRSAWKK